jgi:GNAT superfamily N-acetyltransferase
VADDKSYWLFTNSSGEEVARLELKEAPTLSEAGYTPGVGDEHTVQIGFLDVRKAFRGRGVGRWITDWACSRYPDRRVVALAKKEAEGFWRAIGWDESLSQDEPRNAPMFASPMA